MERLKSLADITQPDPRHQSWQVREKDSGQWRQRTLEDHYAGVASCELSPTVPELVRNSFTIAQNLLLYSWFVYAFVPVAELHALATVEFALRLRGLGDEGGQNSLKAHLREAVDRGWLRDDGVAEFAAASVGNIDLLESIATEPAEGEDPADPQTYVKRLIDVLPGIRNRLAHGTYALEPGAYSTLRIAGQLINQLWSVRDEA